MMIVFIGEPNAKQIAFVEDLLRVFEESNPGRLDQSPVDAESLLFPHEFFVID